VEYWVLGICNSGFIGKNLLVTRKIKNWTFTSYPIIPTFQYSNIPIGAKPLSST
jgi:hypothetical protein